MSDSALNGEYVPSDQEPFMSERQKEYFRRKLDLWKNDILRESRETLDTLSDQSQKMPDAADRASSETDRSIELRARDRQRKLINKIEGEPHGSIDDAFERWEEMITETEYKNGSYNSAKKDSLDNEFKEMETTSALEADLESLLNPKK